MKVNDLLIKFTAFSTQYAKSSPFTRDAETIEEKTSPVPDLSSPIFLTLIDLNSLPFSNIKFSISPSRFNPVITIFEGPSLESSLQSS